MNFLYGHRNLCNERHNYFSIHQLGWVDIWAIKALEEITIVFFFLYTENTSLTEIKLLLIFGHASYPVSKKWYLIVTDQIKVLGRLFDYYKNFCQMMFLDSLY